MAMPEIQAAENARQNAGKSNDERLALSDGKNSLCAMSKVSMTEGQATTGNMVLNFNGVALIDIPSRTWTN